MVGSMSVALLPTRRRGRRDRPWRRTGISRVPSPPALVWVNDSPRSTAIDLECIDAAEADRRAGLGHVPVGLVLSGALLRSEMTRRPAPAWLRHAHRIVVCEGLDEPWLDPSPLGAARLRFLSRPFGPRTFERALAWVARSGPRWEGDRPARPPAPESAA
jgi:hypothetical protein